MSSFLDDLLKIDRFWPCAEFIAPIEIDVLPRDRRDVGEPGGSLDVARAFCVGRQLG